MVNYSQDYYDSIDISRTDEEGVARPPSWLSIEGTPAQKEYCRLPPEEQIFRKQMNSFKVLCKEEAERRKAAKHWSKEKAREFFNRHVTKYEDMVRQEMVTPPDPPCKKWTTKKDQMDPDVFKTLQDIWDSKLPEWSVNYPYLMAPGRPCECNKCRPKKKTARIDTMDNWLPPLEFPND